jgi:hypothetical protein
VTCASCWDLYNRILLRCTDPWTLNTNFFYIKSVGHSSNVKISHHRHVCNSLAIYNTAFHSLVILITPRDECRNFMQLPICVTFYKKSNWTEVFFNLSPYKILGPLIKWRCCHFHPDKFVRPLVFITNCSELRNTTMGQILMIKYSVILPTFYKNPSTGSTVYMERRADGMLLLHAYFISSIKKSHSLETVLLCQFFSPPYFYRSIIKVIVLTGNWYRIRKCFIYLFLKV